MLANNSQASATTTTPPRYVQYGYTVRCGTPLARTWSVAGLPHHRTLLVPIASIIETLLAPGVPMIDDARIANVAAQLAANSLQTLAGNDRLAYLRWTRERQLAQLQGAVSLFRRDVEVGRAKLPTLRVPPHTGGAVALVAVEDVRKVVDAVRRADPRWRAEGEEDALAEVPVELRCFDAVHLVDPAARAWATATLGTVFAPDPPPPVPAPPALPPTPPAAAVPRAEPDRDAGASALKNSDDADRAQPAPREPDDAPALPPTSPRAMGTPFSAVDRPSPPRAMTAPTTVLDVLDQRGAAPSSSSSAIAAAAAAVATPPTWARPAPSVPPVARSPITSATLALACSAPPPALAPTSPPPIAPALALSAPPPAGGLLDDSPVLYVSDDPSPSAAGNRWPDVSFASLSSQGTETGTETDGGAPSPAPAPGIPLLHLQSPSPSSFPCPPLGQVPPPSDSENDDDIVFPSLPPVRARGSSSTPTPASIAAARRSVPAWIRRLQDDEESDSDVEYEGMASTAVSSSDDDAMDVDDDGAAFSLTQVVDSISSQPLQMPLHPVVATPALDAAGALVRIARSGAVAPSVRLVDETVGMLAAVDRENVEMGDER
ncbi:hypothetical protein GGF32_005668, partial [Allomyces javanicus]